MIKPKQSIIKKDIGSQQNKTITIKQDIDRLIYSSGVKMCESMI